MSIPFSYSPHVPTLLGVTSYPIITIVTVTTISMITRGATLAVGGSAPPSSPVGVQALHNSSAVSGFNFSTVWLSRPGRSAQLSLRVLPLALLDMAQAAKADQLKAKLKEKNAVIRHLRKRTRDLEAANKLLCTIQYDLEVKLHMATSAQGKRTRRENAAKEKIAASGVDVTSSENAQKGKGTLKPAGTAEEGPAKMNPSSTAHKGKGKMKPSEVADPAAPDKKSARKKARPQPKKTTKKKAVPRVKALANKSHLVVDESGIVQRIVHADTLAAEGYFP